MSRSVLVPSKSVETDLSFLPISKHKTPTPFEEGTRFGLLTATKEFELRKRSDGRNRCYQKFVCDCGNALFLVNYSVKSGNTRSCGCVHSKNVSSRMKTHGLSKTREYHSNMQRKRRALKNGSQTEQITIQMLSERLNEFNNKCWICKVDLKEMHWDHVQPLSKGGAHKINNLKPTCPQCNVRKSSLWPFTDDMKEAIAKEVRALRTPQEHSIPVQDGLEV